MPDLEEVLTICMGCKKIRLPLSSSNWLDPNHPDHKELYQEYLDLYEGRLSHGYCPACEQKVRSQLGKRKNKPILGLHIKSKFS